MCFLCHFFLSSLSLSLFVIVVIRLVNRIDVDAGTMTMDALFSLSFSLASFVALLHFRNDISDSDLECLNNSYSGNQQRQTAAQE